MSVDVTPQDIETFSSNMAADEMLHWFEKKLERPAELADIIKAATDFYQLGAYSRAILCLRYYIGNSHTPAHSVLIGKHIMAHCLLHMGSHEQALKLFKECAQDGHNDDWQYVVELTIEKEQREERKAMAVDF